MAHTPEMHCLLILKAGVWTQVSAAWLVLRALGKNPLWSSRPWLLVFAGNPWHSLAYRGIVPISASTFTQHFPCVCLYAQISHLCKDTSQVALGPALIKILLTSYICNNLIFKQGHNLRHWALGLQHTNFVGTQLNP